MSDNWKPIETAPKDGTKILGYFPTYRDGGSWWNTWWQGARQEECKFWWYEKEIGGRCPQPTHWKPLDTPGGVGHE